ncbi:hypothetical protein FVEN_g6526 [Fusarium venenatum]|uniref:C2H2-type domain-containing protein n=1 Tax=Fusarium venenatum TaxID=56646 RepID=A0A2L2TJF3_9HYPO|nr:uncharacterized protein FVRRES_04816 [Fusarium venenatum]KAG8355655.1 hypothetical protein FVEN_g6526 [Fusarium venenatum]CEI60380.1 unnamed protein product [Fusarium venenatum]
MSDTSLSLEPYGDIPLRQAQCNIGTISALVDSLARARIIAVIALKILYDEPLNAHRERWICPFSKCKELFANPKDMLFHAATCTHVSANDAYCNCCGSYYNFSGQGPASLTSGNENAPEILRDPAAAKGKQNIVGLSSICSGEAADVGSDRRIVESNTSTIAYPNCSVPTPIMGFHIQQHHTQSTVPIMPSEDHAEPINSDHDDIWMSLMSHVPSAVYQDNTQQEYNGTASHTHRESPSHPLQHYEVAYQASLWDVDTRQTEAEWNTLGQLAMHQQAPKAPIVNVPNLSFPLHRFQFESGGEACSSRIHHLHPQSDVIPNVAPLLRYNSEEYVNLLHFSPTYSNQPDVEMTCDDIPELGAMGGYLATASSSATASPGFPSFGDIDNTEVRCPECNYQPKGADATKGTRLKRHIKEIHKKTIRPKRRTW